MTILLAFLLTFLTAHFLVRAHRLEARMPTSRYREFNSLAVASDQRRLYALVCALLGTFLGSWVLLPLLSFFGISVALRFISPP